MIGIGFIELILLAAVVWWIASSYSEEDGASLPKALGRGLRDHAHWLIPTVVVCIAFSTFRRAPSWMSILFLLSLWWISYSLVTSYVGQNCDTDCNDEPATAGKNCRPIAPAVKQARFDDPLLHGRGANYYMEAFLKSIGTLILLVVGGMFVISSVRVEVTNHGRPELRNVALHQDAAHAHTAVVPHRVERGGYGTSNNNIREYSNAMSPEAARAVPTLLPESELIVPPGDFVVLRSSATTDPSRAKDEIVERAAEILVLTAAQRLHDYPITGGWQPTQEWIEQNAMSEMRLATEEVSPSGVPLQTYEAVIDLSHNRLVQLSAAYTNHLADANILWATKIYTGIILTLGGLAIVMRLGTGRRRTLAAA